MNQEKLQGYFTHKIPALIVGAVLMFIAMSGFRAVSAGSDQSSRTMSPQKYEGSEMVVDQVTRYDSIRREILNELHLHNVTKYDSFLAPYHFAMNKKESDSLWQIPNMQSRVLGLIGLDTKGFMHIHFVRVDTSLSGNPPIGYPNYRKILGVGGTIQEGMPPVKPPGENSNSHPDELSRDFLKYLLRM